MFARSLGFVVANATDKALRGAQSYGLEEVVLERFSSRGIEGDHALQSAGCKWKTGG